jgi:feruloyl esterase
MPPHWNGKLYFEGNTAFAGRVRGDTSLGLSRHYATLSTDTGHHILNPDLGILDASWALNNPTAEAEFGYLSVHQTAVVGKQILAAYYGTGPSLSYFDGCSTGGRQALEEVQRYPTDFNGVVAGAPVLDMTGLMIEYTWDMKALHATATSSDIPAEKLPVIGNAVMAECDAIDGLVDGQIDDPRRCDFDPDTLLCPGADAPNCLTAVQVAALKQIYAGPTNSANQQLYPGLSVGGETPDLSFNGWDLWLVNYADIGSGGQFTIMDQSLRYLAFNPDQPNFDFNTFNFNSDPVHMKNAASVFNATNVDVQAFKDAGGKLLMYQGWSDASAAPLRTIDYFSAMDPGDDSFVRLFMAPGMFHCDHGLGPNSFDYLTALEQWVEGGQAPASLLATHFNDFTNLPDRTRPLCPYPQVASYNGSGDINDAANFHCALP